MENRRDRKRMSQTFDKEKIVLKKAGETINVYDYIQSNREDTELKPTLEKYGCIPTQNIDLNKTAGDFTQLNDMRTMLEQQKKAVEMWNGLPIDVRQSFNNNINDFVENGEKWVQNKIKEVQKQEELKKQQYEMNFKPVQTTIKQPIIKETAGEKNNG